jgi:outer membrane protein
MIQRYTLAFLIVLLLGAVGHVVAQDAPSAQMPAKMALTIPEAIDLAWRNNITSIRQHNQVEYSKADKLATRSTWLPQLDLRAQWSRDEPASIREIQTPTGVQQIVLQNYYGYQFSLSQPIFNGSQGSYLHAPKAASAQLSAEGQNLRATRQTLALETKQFCYNLLQDQRLADVQERAVKRSIEQLETSKARYDLGSASMSDYLKSKVQLGTDSLTLITRTNAIEISRAELNNHLALPVDRSTEIEVNLEFETYPLPSQPAIDAAVENHPAVQNKDFEVKRWSYELGNTQFTRLPSINAVASYGWGSSEFPSDVGDVFETDAASIGINLNWNLFSGFTTTSRVNRAKVARHAAESELAQIKRDVRLAIAKAALNVGEAEKRWGVSKDQVESAQEDLNIAQEKYNLGAATILDILVAQVNLSEAETGQIQAGYDWLLSIAELERAMGGGD